MISLITYKNTWKSNTLSKSMFFLIRFYIIYTNIAHEFCNIIMHVIYIITSIESLYLKVCIINDHEKIVFDNRIKNN